VRITPFGKKVIKSGTWVFAARALEQLFTAARLIVLARLLSPDDFGVFGIALLILSVLDTFSRTGFRQALIQKSGDAAPYMDTAWTVGLIRSFIIAGAVFVAAPFAAEFFRTPQAVPIIRAIGAAIILQGLTNIKVVCFEKELEFHKFFTYQTAGIVTDAVVAIGAAVILRNPWALVFGRLAGNFARCAASYAIDPYRPRPRLDAARARELFGFGKWVFGSSMLLFLITHGDDLFVGKIIGAAALGLYQMAYLIANLPATEITHVISRIAFPAYSKLQHNAAKFKDSYVKILELTMLLVLPAAALIFSLAPEIISVFLGAKWLPVVPAMKILCIFAVARAIGATSGSVLYGAGAPHVATVTSAIKLVFLAVLLYPLTKRFGIAGTAMATTLPVFVSLLYCVRQTLKIIDCPAPDFLRAVMPPVLGAMLILPAAYAARCFLAAEPAVLVAGIIVGCAVYAVFIMTVGRFYRRYDAVRVLIEIAKNLKGGDELSAEKQGQTAG